MVGKVIKVNKVAGTPNPHSYIIEDSDSNTYLVHVGDIKENEDFLYQHYDDNKTAKLKEGDKVKFNPDTHEHAIHVKKAS